MKRFCIFFVGLLFVFSCATLPPEETSSQVVTLDASADLKAEAFQFSVTHLFRRYNPVMVEPLKCTAQYGKYPVTIWYQDNTVYIRSSCPGKHAGWLASIREGMRRDRR